MLIIMPILGINNIYRSFHVPFDRGNPDMLEQYTRILETSEEQMRLIAELNVAPDFFYNEFLEGDN